MKLTWANFRGRIPRAAPRALPPDNAQTALNTRMLSSDLEPWSGLTSEFTLPHINAVINTIYRLNAPDPLRGSAPPVWLAWGQDEIGSGQTNVDVALGPVPGDTTHRYIFTGTGLPRVSNLDLSTNAAYRGSRPVQAYPYKSYKLGVPAPLVAPTATVAFTGTAKQVVTNDGTSLAGWVTSTAVDTGTDPHRNVQSVQAGTIAAPLAPAYASHTIQVVGAEDSSGGFISSPYFALLAATNGAIYTTFSYDFAAFDWENQATSQGAVFRFHFFAEGSTGKGPAVDVVLNSSGAGGANPSAQLGLGTVSVWGTQASQVLLTTGATSTLAATDCYLGVGLTIAKPLRLKIIATLVPGTTDQYAVTVTLTRLDTATNVATLSGTLTSSGGAVGASDLSTSQTFGNRKIQTYTNINVAEAGPNTTAENTTYVYTYVNALQEESAPSPASSEIVRSTDAGFTYTITSLAEPSLTDIVDYGIVAKRLYRIVTGTSGAAYELVNTEGDIPIHYVTDAAFSTVNNLFNSATAAFVAGDVGSVVTAPQVTAGTTIASLVSSSSVHMSVNAATSGSPVPAAYSHDDYNDTKTDSQLGEVLPSGDPIWSLPPSDLQGVLALPNGVTVGFSKNTLCPSAVNQPHAYPVAYQLATDTPIVAIAAIDANVVVLTQSFPYVVTGSSPDSLTMTKLEVPQGCASKRSVAYLRGVGVLYASPTGLWAVSAVGQVVNTTAGLFTRREWKALVPTSIIGVAQDDRYFGFYNNGTVIAGFILDFREGGFGVVDIPEHAIATFADPLTDTLYLIHDQVTIPLTTGFLNPAPPTVSAKNILAWDNGGTALNYKWRSKLYLLPEPTMFNAAQVKAVDYTNLTFNLYVDGTQILTKVVTTADEFVLPPVRGTQFEMEIIGTSRVQQVEVAEDVMELA